MSAERPADAPGSAPGPHGDAAAAAEPLAGRARRAIAWTTGFQLFRDLLQFGQMLVLVRLLPAEVYGQFGFVTTLLGFLTLYSFREFLGHTLQVRDREPVHYQDHFTFGAVVQVGVCLAANGIAVGLRWIPAYAPVAPLLHVMSILFLLDLPSEFRVRMLERALDWKRLRLLHGLALVIASACSIALAVAGWGVYALLLPTLLVPLPFIFDLFVREGWRPTWRFSWTRFRPSWRFGGSRIAAVSFVSAATLAESSWLAGVLGFATLGIFGRAIGLTQLVCGRLAFLLASAVYPVLTRIPPRTDSYRRASALYLRAISWIVVPAATLTAMLAMPVVDALYGRQWLDVVPMLPWTMAGGALMAVVQTGYTLLLAHGSRDHCLRADIWRFVGTIASLALLLPLGIGHYLEALVAVHLVSLALILRWLVRESLLSARGLTDAFLPPISSAIVAAAALGGVRTAAPASGSAIVDALAFAALFAAVYVIALRTVFARPLGQLVAYLPQRHGICRLLRLEPAA